MIGGNTGAGIDFTNRTGATVYGKFALGNGNDTVTLYTGSTVTGSINAGGGNDTLNLKGTGTQTLPSNVTNFSNLNKEDAGQWTLSSTLSTVLSGATPRNVQARGGTLILTGDNSSFIGSTTVDAGATLEGPSVSIPGPVTNNGLVRFNETGTGTYAGVISGTGALEKVGSGTTTLTGANTYSGNTTINAGTLAGGAANAFSASSLTTINPTGTVNLGGLAQSINAVSLAGGTITNGALTGAITSTGGTVNSITGSASLTNTSGTTTLTGTNGYTGATTVNGGTVTLAPGASLASPTSVGSGGTFNISNTSATTGAVNNACGGAVNNFGAINNSVTNAGAFTNAATGAINGTFTNNNPCGVVTNNGSMSGVVTNNGVFTNNTGGAISSNVTNGLNASFTNKGPITGNVENSGTFYNDTGAGIGGTFFNGNTGNLENHGTIDGTVTNNGAGINFGTFTTTLINNNIFDNRGQIRDVTNTGTFDNAGTLTHSLTNSGLATNDAGGIINGSIDNAIGGQLDNYGRMNGAVTNDGVLNLNGTLTLAGNINNNGTTNLNVTQTLSNADFVNNGILAPLASSTNLNLTGSGVYSQGSGANFITHIDGLTTGSYSQVTSQQPINIADGAIITAALNPALRLNPGDTVHDVIKGNGTPTQQGAINVNTLSDRYKLDYRYDGQNVDLFLPVNSGGTLQKYGERGTYYGALTTQTMWSLSAIKGPTTDALHQRYAVLNAVMSYDCNRFDKYNFCISAQARATGFGSQATGAGVFNIAYRPTNQTRIGAFLDYQVTGGSPSVDGLPVAGTLSSGSVRYGYNNPTFGGYIGFSQSGYSGNPLNNGIQAFVSGGYNPGKISITRAIIVDPNLPFVDSQPGSGSASLNAYYARGMLGYGVGIAENLILMPYVGIRYTDVTRGGYMENFNLLVTQPLVYNAYYERLVTGFGGGMLNGRLGDKLGMMLGLGAETDFSRSANSFSGYSPIQLQADNLPFGFGHGGNWNGLRPTGMAGAYYDVAPNQRVMVNGFAGEQAWSSRGYLTGLAGYQVAF